MCINLLCMDVKCLYFDDFFKKQLQEVRDKIIKTKR